MDPNVKVERTKARHEAALILVGLRRALRRIRTQPNR